MFQPNHINCRSIVVERVQNAFDPNRRAHLNGDMNFFILWNPDAPMPPKVTFTSEEEAWAVAEEMARKHTGSRFFVLKAQGFAVTEEPVVRKMIPQSAPKAPAKRATTKRVK